MHFRLLAKPVATLMFVALAAAALSACVTAPPPQPFGQAMFVPGGSLPPRYQADAYAVNDWQSRGLDAPPAGYGWHYVDGQYVLSAVATGLIAAAFLGALLGGGPHGPGGGFGPR